MFGGGLKKLKGVKEDKIGDIDNQLLGDEEGDPMPTGPKNTASGLPDIHAPRGGANQDIIVPRQRLKNKDENPQEFEEVGSQEEQSQGRAIE